MLNSKDQEKLHLNALSDIWDDVGHPGLPIWKAEGLRNKICGILWEEDLNWRCL